MRLLFGPLAMLVLAVPVTAQVTALRSVVRDLSGAPTGFVVYGIEIDFEGQLLSQQMLVTLTSGSIYEDAVFGGSTAPSGALFAAFPSLAADTFVTMGGYTSGDSHPVILLGPATDLVNPIPSVTPQLNVAWAPAPGAVLNGGVDFPIAQLTFSDDVYGAIVIYSSSSSGATLVQGRISAGSLFAIFPEPTTTSLAVMAFLSAAVRRRRSTRVELLGDGPCCV